MSYKALLHPQHSRMEEDVYDDLAEEGIYPFRDITFYIPTEQQPKLSTTPDQYYPDKRVAVYLDGAKVHFKRQEKDKRLRYLLKKRYGLRILSITYNGRSNRERRRIVGEIVAFLEEQKQ